LKICIGAIRTIDSIAVPDQNATEIAQAAVSGTCPASVAALDMFCAMLGTMAGNVALTVGAHGGVYIGGGIVPPIVDYLAGSEFRTRFEAKGRFRNYLRAIPTNVIIHADPSFIGLRALVEQQFGAKTIAFLVQNLRGGNMTTTDNPYPLPAEMSPTLLRVFFYWESLKRGDNNMPFWDDVKLSTLSDLTDRLLLIDVFANPERFRFNFTGKDFVESDESLAGKFADEVELRGRLKYLRSQCSATVEGREPTLYHRQGSATGAAFSRLLMPMWGDGHIGMLLGALNLH
jgi:hypothetical protein